MLCGRFLGVGTGPVPAQLHARAKLPQEKNFSNNNVTQLPLPGHRADTGPVPTDQNKTAYQTAKGAG